MIIYVSRCLLLGLSWSKPKISINRAIPFNCKYLDLIEQTIDFFRRTVAG